MRILYVQDSLGTGGAERSNAEMWYFLKEKKNVTLKIIVLEHRKVGIEDEIINAGFDVTFLKKGDFIKQVFQLKSYIKEFNPTIVHSVLFKSFIRVRFAKLLTNFFHLESIVNCSYSEVRYKDPKINSIGLTFFKYVNRFTQNFGVDNFVALTKEVKNHTIEHIGANPDKIKVIPRGRRENMYLPRKEECRKIYLEEFNLEDTDTILIHVGRQEYQKGHMDLLRAIKSKDEELNNENSVFLFCGRKGNATEEIQKFLSINKLKTRIFWLGHRHDVNKLLVASNIFVFPSLFEGLGGALIEAQAAGLPIICSDIKVFEEVVVKDSNALIFKVENETELASCLLKMGSSKNLREEYGKQSLRNFKSKFLIDDIHEKMYTLYKETQK